MKLIKTEIENFRSIKKCVIKHKKTTALVGKNNAGKSSLLRALNSFFNYEEEELFFLQDAHQYTNTRSPKITLTFSGITNKEKYEQYLNDETLTIRMTYSRSKKKREISYKKDQKFYKTTEDFIDSLKEDITFVLIPVNRDNTEVIWNENSLLKSLLDEHFKYSTSKRDTLSPKVKKLAGELEESGLQKIQKAIEGKYSLNKKFKFLFNFDEQIDYSLLLDRINIKMVEDGLHFNITEAGSGIQSLTIIAMYRYLAELKYTNIMLGIEEPEINLHPQAQREFVQNLKQVEDHDTQIIFTTHSSIIVDQLDHDEIVLFRKLKDEKRGFKTSVYQIPDDFFEKYDLKKEKYYKFHRYKNSDLFFSDCVIVVESSTDADVINSLVLKYGIDLTLSGVTLLELDGVKSLRYLFYLLDILSIPKLIIVDKDFFLPYLNDQLSKSQDNRGLPRYRYEFASDQKTLIEDMIPNERKRIQLLNLFQKNHSKALNLLEEFDIVSMNYNLEIDLLNSNKAVEVFCEKLNVPFENHADTRKQLLLEQHKKIKKSFLLIEVIEELTKRNLPNSFKRILKLITEIVS